MYQTVKIMLEASIDLDYNTLISYSFTYTNLGFPNLKSVKCLFLHDVRGKVNKLSEAASVSKGKTTPRTPIGCPSSFMPYYRLN